MFAIATTAYYVYRQRLAGATRHPTRVQRDTTVQVDIARIYRENHDVHGVRKVWRQLQRDGIVIARCTVERLMRACVQRRLTQGRTKRQAMHCPKRFLARAVDRTAQDDRASRTSPHQHRLAHVTSWERPGALHGGSLVGQPSNRFRVSAVIARTTTLTEPKTSCGPATALAACNASSRMPSSRSQTSATNS